MKRILCNELRRIFFSFCPYATILMLIVIPVIDAFVDNEFVDNFAFFYFGEKNSFLSIMVMVIVTYLIIQMVDSVSMAEYIQAGYSRKQMYFSMFMCAWITSSIILLSSQFGLAAVMYFVKGQRIICLGFENYLLITGALLLSSAFYSAFMCLIISFIANVIAVPVIYLFSTIMENAFVMCMDFFDIKAIKSSGLIISNMYSNEDFTIQSISLGIIEILLYLTIFLIIGWLHYRKKEL